MLIQNDLLTLFKYILYMYNTKCIHVLIIITYVCIKRIYGAYNLKTITYTTWFVDI